MCCKGTTLIVFHQHKQTDLLSKKEKNHLNWFRPVRAVKRKTQSSPVFKEHLVTYLFIFVQ